MNNKFLIDLCILLKEKNIDCRQVDFDTNFSDLLLDEIDIYDLCFSFEKLYGIILNEQQIINIKSVRDLFNFIKGVE